MLYFGSLFSLFLLSEHAFAGGSDLAGLADNVTSNIEAVAKLITAASYVAGVGFALAGMVKFKAHRDNPTQVPLSAPIVLIAVAAGLVFLPSIIGTAGETVFGGDQATGGASGQGIDSFN
ncbi:MAG: type IV secretion protein IcmD [Legionellales bacterium]|nr:type IV secretion protein IcmD [Legionellales bacterium]